MQLCSLPCSVSWPNTVTRSRTDGSFPPWIYYNIPTKQYQELSNLAITEHHCTGLYTGSSSRTKSEYLFYVYPCILCYLFMNFQNCLSPFQGRGTRAYPKTIGTRCPTLATVGHTHAQKHRIWVYKSHPMGPI